MYKTQDVCLQCVNVSGASKNFLVSAMQSLKTAFKAKNPPTPNHTNLSLFFCSKNLSGYYSYSQSILTSLTALFESQTI
jgi:hypothetical protein